MLLTLTTTHRPATDIGYLLHKNPANLHSVALSFGQAHVFYPKATDEECTAALLLDVDPIGLVRKEGRAGDHFALKPYVNDRPYVASSFMSVAIGRVFGTLLAGNCKQKPELVASDLPLVARIDVLPCRGGEVLLRRLFEPLGYEVAAMGQPIDEQFPEWGDSPYFTVTLKRRCSLRELLIHLYVLIPVLDNEKHYWIGEEEIEKLLRFGEGWLESHPERETITRRYLKNFRPLFGVALGCLGQMETDTAIPEREETPEKVNLNSERLNRVVSWLKELGARRVIDLGCGEGKLLGLLLKDNSFSEIVGGDVSSRALEIARDRLKLDQLPDAQRARLRLMQIALTYRDKRLAGFDAACLMEVIEHLDLSRLEALQRVVFEFALPKQVIITTPNAEYNALFEHLPADRFRHADHRFEWSRAEFEHWAKTVAERFGYTVRFDGIGPRHPGRGAPTQAGIFTRQEAPNAA